MRLLLALLVFLAVAVPALWAVARMFDEPGDGEDWEEAK